MALATHYGIHVDSLDDARERLGVLGFVSVEVDGPRRYSAADPVGAAVAWVYGDVFSAETLEAPWGQELELIETTPAYRVERPTDAPVQGDTTVAIPVPDPAGASDVLGVADAQSVTGGLRGTAFGGQHLFLTRGPSPWATIHYGPDGWQRSQAFLTDALGLRVVALAEGRFLVADGGGRVEAHIGASTAVADPALGKRYVGAGHVALIGIDMARLVERMPHHPGATPLQPLGPRGGNLHGPAGDSFEVHAGRRPLQPGST